MCCNVEISKEQRASVLNSVYKCQRKESDLSDNRAMYSYTCIKRSLATKTSEAQVGDEENVFIIGLNRIMLTIQRSLQSCVTDRLRLR